MKWNVFYHNWNSNKIEAFNVFGHSSFKKEVMECLKKYEDRDEFAEQMRRSLFYYFCSKCEWEIVISPWVGGDKNTPEKIDVYRQVMMNWDTFLDYVWQQRGTCQ